MKLKILFITLLVSFFGWGQMLIPNSTPVTQNFDGLGSSGIATLPTGFKLGNNTNDYTNVLNTTVTTLAAGTTGTGVLTSGSGGGCYNFANGITASSTDRALGFLTSGSYSSPRSIIVAIQNTGTNNITDLEISFDYEKYRSGIRAFNWTFFHGPTATAVNTSATAGDQAFAADANNTTIFNPPTTISKTVTLTGLTIAPSALYYLCWTYTGVGGSTNGQGLGIDNLSITALSPCPATVVGSISLFSSSCGSSVLTYNGADAANCYWQTSPGGTSTTNVATSNYTVLTSGTYYIRNYSGTCWSTGNVSSTITVSNNPAITSSPSNTTVFETATATFTVVATNPGSYQWQVDYNNDGTFDANVTNGGVYSGASTATLTITGATLAMSGYVYKCIVLPQAPCLPQAVSGNALLTVNPNVSSASDIVAVASSEPSTIPSTVNNVTISSSSDGAQVWQFTVRDGGGTTDADAYPTTLTALTIAQSAGDSVGIWTDAIFSIGLFDGTTFIANGTVTSNQIQFSGLNVVVADGTNKTLSLRLSLKCPLLTTAVDGDDFGFSISAANTTFLATGSGKAAFSAAISANSFNVIAVVATKLTFTTQPVSTGQNNTMATVVVKATDACGNTDINFTGSVSLTSTGTMNAVTPITMTAGVASFNTIVHTVVGTGYTLTASSTGVTNGVSTTFNINVVTIFSEGDFAVVGVNSNMNPGPPAPVCTYSGPNAPYSAGDDEISFITFKDIQNGDVFYITDNGYERSFVGLWGETEGIYQFTRNGTTIPAGTIITFRFLNNSPFMEFVSPDTSWTFTKPSGFTGTLNTNSASSGGDQIFFMQGGTWNNPIALTHDATYTGGTLLYAFNTGTTWTSLGNSTQQSGLPLALRCFNMMPGVAADYIEYTGPTTAASKFDWIVRLNDPLNWTRRVSCVDYTRMHVGQTYTVLGDAYVNGVWTGSKSTDWFDCANWQTLKVPVATTDVSVNATYATKDAVIDVINNSSTASLYSNLAICNNITVSAKKVQLEGSPSNTLDVKGNLTISGTGAIDMDDSNSGTVDGQINLYGNWTNSVGNTAFSEGNGTVNFTGTGTQVISNVTPEGTETYNNVILNNNFNTGVSNDLIASNNLTVTASKTLTIDSAGYARVNNKLSNNGNILIDSDVAGTGAGQLIQVNDTDSNDGDYTGTKFQVKRTAMAKHTDYVYWSSPIATFDVSGLPNGFRYQWNTTGVNTNGTQGNWFPATGNMATGKGFIARASNGSASAIALPLTFSGSKPNNGSYTFGISRGNYTGADYDADLSNALNVNTTKYDDNWNLVGNPYPSAIDAESFLVLNQSVIEGAVWIWKHGLVPNSSTSPFYANFTYNYSSLDYIKYNGLGSTEPDTFAGKIGSGQGFMVNMKDVGTFLSAGSNTNLDVYTGSITFNNSLRSDSTTTPYTPHNNSDFYKAANIHNDMINNPTTGVEEKHRMWLDIINDTSHQTDRMLLGYSTHSTMGRDNLYDCFFVPRGNVSLYSLIGEDSFIIQGRPLPFDNNDQVPLGINIIEAGSHTIAIKKVDGMFVSNLQIYLEDKTLNIIHDLKQSPYVFTSVKGKFNNRFVLRYTNEALSTPNFDTMASSVVVAANQGEITINSYIEAINEVTVFDVLGRKLFNGKSINSNSFTTSTISLSQQTLIVKIKLENGITISKKIIL